jgi:hypothetical protein
MRPTLRLMFPLAMVRIVKTFCGRNCSMRPARMATCSPFFVVCEAAGGNPKGLYVSPDWPSAEPTKKDALHTSGRRYTERSNGGAIVKIRGSLAKQ